MCTQQPVLLNRTTAAVSPAVCAAIVRMTDVLAHHDRVRLELVATQKWDTGWLRAFVFAHSFRYCEVATFQLLQLFNLKCVHRVIITELTPQDRRTDLSKLRVLLVMLCKSCTLAPNLRKSAQATIVTHAYASRSLLDSQVRGCLSVQVSLPAAPVELMGNDDGGKYQAVDTSSQDIYLVEFLSLRRA